MTTKSVLGNANSEDSWETLSLSDLPLYSCSSIDHHAAPPLPTAHRHHQDFDFDFFSEDFTASTRRTPPDTILFCGKIIHPFLESPQRPPFPTKTLHHYNKTAPIRLFHWKSPKSKPRKVLTRNHVSVSPETDKYKFSVEKVSVQYSSKSNPNNKWYLFKFGLGSKMPAEMELRDIKTRPRCRRGDAGETGSTGDRVKGKGFWGLLTSLRRKTSRYLAT